MCTSAPMACSPATWIFTGRAPIAQPPGSDTSAAPWRATSGPRSSIMVVTSFRWGTLPIVTGPSASSAPAKMGRVAFLAPEMRTSPSSGTPPRICNLSTRASPSARVAGGCQVAPFPRRVRLDRQRVDLPAHACPEGTVDLLMTLDRSLTFESLGDDHRREVGVVVGDHANPRTGQAGLDQPGDFVGGHVRALRERAAILPQAGRLPASRPIGA